MLDNELNTASISTSIAALTHSRVILSEAELGRSARSILGHMEYKRCKLFNLRVSKEDDLKAYIQKQVNIHFVTKDIGLPKDVDGVVIKKQLENTDQDGECNTYVYLLVVSPYVQEEHERAFTIAHELGHIFLHGKLLEADLMTPRRSLRWYQSTNRLRPLMEAEANIFALYLLVPLSLLEITFNKLPVSERKNYIYYVKNILERIFKSKIDVCIVVARLYLYQLTKCSGLLCNREIGDFRLDKVCKRGYSWIVHGLDSKYEECEGDQIIEPKIDGSLIDDIIFTLKSKSIC